MNGRREPGCSWSGSVLNCVVLEHRIMLTGVEKESAGVSKEARVLTARAILWVGRKIWPQPSAWTLSLCKDPIPRDVRA